MQEIPKGGAVEMNVPNREMPAGLRGIVDFVDDVASVHITWQNDSTLAATAEINWIRCIRFGEFCPAEALDTAGVGSQEEHVKTFNACPSSPPGPLRLHAFLGRHADFWQCGLSDTRPDRSPCRTLPAPPRASAYSTSPWSFCSSPW